MNIKSLRISKFCIIIQVALTTAHVKRADSAIFVLDCNRGQELWRQL